MPDYGTEFTSNAMIDWSEATEGDADRLGGPCRDARSPRRRRDAEIAHLKLTIAKMQRDRFGASSERGAKHLDQLKLQLAELDEAQAEDRAAIDMAAPPTDVAERKKPARRPLPGHRPRQPEG